MLLFLLSTLEPIVRSSRDRRILCGNSFAGFDVTFWETPRSVSLACVCLIDNMRWKHLAVLFVRRRTRFFELVHPSHRKPVRLEAFPLRSFSFWSLHPWNRRGIAMYCLINGKKKAKRRKHAQHHPPRLRRDSRTRSQCVVSSQRHYFMFLYQSCSV